MAEILTKRAPESDALIGRLQGPEKPLVQRLGATFKGQKELLEMNFFRAQKGCRSRSYSQREGAL